MVCLSGEICDGEAVSCEVVGRMGIYDINTMPYNKKQQQQQLGICSSPTANKLDDRRQDGNDAVAGWRRKMEGGDPSETVFQ